MRSAASLLAVLGLAVGASGGVAAASGSGGAAPQGQPTLHRGSHGPAVRRLQEDLDTAGYPTSADGAFGPGTRRSVEAYERDHHLRVDGVVPAAEARAIHRDALRAAPRTTPGSRARLTRSGLAIAPARAPRAVKAFIAAANRIAHKPYRYGGGHGSWNDSGYDCSGSVSYGLHGARLLRYPLDSSSFMHWGAAGRGRWMTIYTNPGHVYMVVAGLRFDTSARYERGSRWTRTQRSSSGYRVRHPRGY